MVYHGIIQGGTFEDIISTLESTRELELVNCETEFCDDKKSVLFVFEKYYKRTNTIAAVIVFIVEKEGKKSISLTSAGCGSGLFRMTFNTEKDIIELVKKSLAEYDLIEE